MYCLINVNEDMTERERHLLKALLNGNHLRKKQISKLNRYYETNAVIILMQKIHYYMPNYSNFSCKISRYSHATLVLMISHVFVELGKTHQISNSMVVSVCKQE